MIARSIGKLLLILAFSLLLVQFSGVQANANDRSGSTSIQAGDQVIALSSSHDAQIELVRRRGYWRGGYYGYPYRYSYRYPYYGSYYRYPYYGRYSYRPYYYYNYRPYGGYAWSW
ncbi:hypothetical protein [Desulfomonile tiedjei]|uniref:Uncharacterized protein n=1 Tax=Desulfomonile tiedjei (strain ATCC 49306 / DSM 6799 / DCB-1) TaxID=706587 RepID=I4C2T2_DESTA|nr:hypothetical protein [Desulfomonile tiedjei]AFM23873.1 hypothetical protein Desti_1160 [Desulfomonile tiedjei DSM 6799]